NLRQWQCQASRSPGGYAVAVGAARRPELHRYEIRMRHGLVRGLHGSRGWRSRALMPDHGFRRGEQESRDHRGALTRQLTSPAARLDRRASATVRLLPARADHAGSGAAGEKASSHRRRHRPRDGRQLVSLRDVPEDPQGHPPGRGRRWAMKVSRRAFLVGGAAAGAAIVIGIKLPRLFGEEVPGPFQAWVRLTPDGKLALIVAKSEMGQGISTGLPMILADEAAMDLKDVSIVQAETDPSLYTHLGTGGSESTMESYEPLRQAGAQIRSVMIVAAAREWGVPAGECAAAASAVTHAASGRKATYAQLFKVASTLPLPSAASVKLKDPSQFTLIGKEVLRIDVPSKVNGSARFDLDTRLPGMVYAVIGRCPTFGGKPVGFDAKKALAVPGVLKVFEVPAVPQSFTAGGIAVVAANTWAALKGREALEITWNHGPHANENSPTLRKQLLEATAGQGKSIVEQGHAKEVLASATRRVDAVYEFPFLAHATMEPMNLTAHRTLDGIELWAPTQSPDWIQVTVARLLNLTPKNVVVHTTWMGGGFGRRYHTDFGVEAAQVADVVRQPVQLVWSREDDIAHDFYRPAVCHRMSGALDAAGNPVAWLDRLSSTSIRAWWNQRQPPEQQEIG